MYSSTCTTAIGVFSTRERANEAISALYEAGFTSSQIGLVSKGELNTTTSEETNDVAENAGTGAFTGAVAGAGIGGLIGLGVLAGMVPVIGPALFAGTLGVLASNAAAGAAVVGVVGTLTGWGIPAEHAKHYEGELAAGRSIVTVTSERCGDARAIMREYGATSKDPAFADSVRA